MKESSHIDPSKGKAAKIIGVVFHIDGDTYDKPLNDDKEQQWDLESENGTLWEVELKPRVGAAALAGLS